MYYSMANIEKEKVPVSSIVRCLRIAFVIGVVMYGLYVSLSNRSFAAQRWNPDDLLDNSVANWEKRLKPIPSLIPKTTTTLGYLADWNIPGVEYNLTDQDTEYVLTQYALAPLIVQPGLDHEWIIGNFSDANFRSWLDQNLLKYEIKKIGFGIYLIHWIYP